VRDPMSKVTAINIRYRLCSIQPGYCLLRKELLA
jgi:hypothetical protein